MKIVFVAATLAAIAVGCSKNNDEVTTPSFKAEGLWNGAAFGQPCVIYNRADRKATIYFVPPGSNDTSAATFKYPGTYILSGNGYSARFIAPNDTAYLEMAFKTINHLSGVFLVRSTNSVGLAELVKPY
jgi:hypothetical protein